VTSDIRRWIADLANAADEYSVIPVQGSGTFAIEAALTTFVKDTDKVLVCVNGVYGETAAKILRRHRLRHTVLSRPITEPVSVAETEAALAKRPAAFPQVLPTSSHKGTGMPELRAAMVRLLRERGQ
jgi:aspartate aminotransferase-like enzyme